MNRICAGKYLLLGLLFAGAAQVHAQSASPTGTSLYFISPADGQSVGNPITVRFGLSGMGVAPAGVERENTGHHHLLIDVDALPALDQPVPADDKHRHFGAGQTETVIELPPGEHTLQLLLGDYLHRPHQPVVVSERIVIRVE